MPTTECKAHGTLPHEHSGILIERKLDNNIFRTAYLALLLSSINSQAFDIDTIKTNLFKYVYIGNAIITIIDGFGA